MYIPWTGFSPKSEQPKKIMRLSKHVHSERCMTQCPEMRNRCRSFDLHHIGQQEKKPSLLSRLFRSKSDDSMKIGGLQNSPKSSPKASPSAAQRRRFLRVVRDDQNAGEEFVNPHVVRKYNRNYWEKRNEMCKSQSLDEGRSSSLSPPKERLPYSVTGHTILKKYHSMDDTSVVASSPKHATFKEEVEVVEFDMKSKCVVIQDANVCHERLHDDTAPSFGLCVRAEHEGLEYPGCRELLAAIDDDIHDSIASLGVISESDEKLRSPSEECVDFVTKPDEEDIGAVASDSFADSDEDSCQFYAPLDDDEENALDLQDLNSDESDTVAAKVSKVEPSSVSPTPEDLIGRAQ